jgi:transcriptional regulator GlxA family with amidase domain
MCQHAVAALAANSERLKESLRIAMSFADLSALTHEAPLLIRLIIAEPEPSITWVGLSQPLRQAAGSLGAGRLRVDLVSAEALAPGAAIGDRSHVTLLVAGPDCKAPPPAMLEVLIAVCRQAPVWGGVGAPVLWLANAGLMAGVRIALPWALYGDADETGEHAILTPQLFEFDRGRLTCCGGAASMDFALALIQAFYGNQLQADIREALCIDSLRNAGDRQRTALQARFGVLQPKLSEALALMEANIEEPLTTDDLANLVGISRRQLERQFRQYLGSVPSRYYLELRLQRARRLLLESSHSIVQVGLMCGFSSGSHFSTAYGTLFGITPREERQRRLMS